MLLRNRLKKELANLLKLKNNEVIGSILYILAITILVIISNEYSKMPEDNRSSGVFFARTGNVDNHNSVTNYKYTLKTQENQKKYCLKDLNYSFWMELIIPGMPDTREMDYENGYIFDTNQCLQGLCFTDKYVLITSDSVEYSCYGELMIFDRETGAYLVTLAMDEQSHMGGVTWDGKNIWVCNSSNNTIERLSYSFVQKAASQKYGRVINVTNLMEVYEVINSPSGITYAEDCLWIVSHNIWGNSYMVSYAFDMADNELQVLNSYNIPSQVQGITFDDSGKVYLSMSYGRRRSSYIRKYESIYTMNRNVENYTMLIEMPPCSEEIVYNAGQLYVLFESAGEKYLDGTDGLGKSICPIDKILIIDLTLP